MKAADTQKEKNTENENYRSMTNDEKIDFVAKSILTRYREAFEELAK